MSTTFVILFYSSINQSTFFFKNPYLFIHIHTLTCIATIVVVHVLRNHPSYEPFRANHFTKRQRYLSHRAIRVNILTIDAFKHLTSIDHNVDETHRVIHGGRLRCKNSIIVLPAGSFFFFFPNDCINKSITNQSIYTHFLPPFSFSSPLAYFSSNYQNMYTPTSSKTIEWVSVLLALLVFATLVAIVIYFSQKSKTTKQVSRTTTLNTGAAAPRV